MLWWQDETSGQDLERGGGGQEVQKTVMIKKWIMDIFVVQVLNLLRVREIFTFNLIDIYSQKADQVFYDSLYHRKWGKGAGAKSLQAPTKYLVNSIFSSNLSDSSELCFKKLSLPDLGNLHKYF